MSRLSGRLRLPNWAKIVHFDATILELVLLGRSLAQVAWSIAVQTFVCYFAKSSSYINYIDQSFPKHNKI